MRINHIIIKQSGILKNINTSCSQVNLIVGDNERGKTTLLDWVARGAFEKPTSNHDHQWSTTIDNHSNVQFDLDSISYQYDSSRMKNLLTFKETDLLFKHKNKEELFKQEYWNTEINSLLYGNDEISNSLQKNFLHAMGVETKNKKNSWLLHLHNILFELKNALEDLLPEFESITSKSYGIHQLNQSLSKISQSEKEFQQKELLYFTMDKIKAANQYLLLVEKRNNINDSILERENLQKNLESLNTELTQKDNMILDYEDELDQLKIDIHKKEKQAQQISMEPLKAYQTELGKTIFQAFFGVILIILGLSLAFQSMYTVKMSFIKGLSLLYFIAGAFFLVKIGIKSIAVQNLSESSEDNPNMIHRMFIQKAQKSIRNARKTEEYNLSQLRILKEEVAQIRKDLKNIHLKLETSRKVQRENELFQQEFSTQQQLVLDLFHTDDVEYIQQHVADLNAQIGEHTPSFNYDELQQLRQEKETLLQQKTEISDDCNSSQYKISKHIRALIDELQDSNNKDTIRHFYPEIFQLNTKHHDLSTYINLLEAVDYLINKVSNDRYRAEKLVSIFNQIESNSETLLAKILNTNFFVYLTQNIFGGKYHHFITKNVPNEGIKIFAETPDNELFPLESLSAGAYSQFWFILKMALAKSIIKNQHGILILDDPFTSFDTTRKQYFLDAINALVHQGWQIFISVTYDPQIEEYFSSMFQPVLTKIDLNKE